MDSGNRNHVAGENTSILSFFLSKNFDRGDICLYNSSTFLFSPPLPQVFRPPHLYPSPRAPSGAPYIAFSSQNAFHPNLHCHRMSFQPKCERQILVI